MLAGREEIKVPKPSKIEEYCGYKRDRVVYRDRSFDLHHLRKDTFEALLNNREVIRKIVRFNIHQQRRKSC